jgi:hypothetical protein
MPSADLEQSTQQSPGRASREHLPIDNRPITSAFTLAMSSMIPFSFRDYQSEVDAIPRRFKIRTRLAAWS